jgi:hypothetical protein
MRSTLRQRSVTHINYIDRRIPKYILIYVKSESIEIRNDFQRDLWFARDDHP